MGATAYLTAKFTAPTGPWHALLFPVAALAIIVAGRLADHLWDSTMRPALAPLGAVFSTLLRYAFRVQGGGIAFTTVLLFARRAGLIPLRDVPVVEIFSIGAVLAAAWHVAVETWEWKSGAWRSGGSEPPTSKDGS